MVGASAQLAAFGAADQYLSAQPQITYFKQIWRRYTQFAMEAIEQSWTGDVDFGKKATINLSRAGDLVTEVWLQVKLPDLVDLNHITSATASASEPVIYYARNTTQDTLKVDAHTCNNATNYLASFRSTAASNIVSAARLNTANLGVTLTTTATPADTLRLVPFGSGSTGLPTITPSGSTTTWTSTALAPGVSYAVCYGTDTSSRTNILRLQSSATSSVSFTVTGADPAVTYQAQVATVASAAQVLSVAQSVLKAKWCNSVGHALISAVEWELGGSRIDRHTAEHFDMWCEVSESEEKRAGYSDMIGRYDSYDINYDAKSSSGSRYLFVPMRFSFNTSPGSALPLLALQFHDCKLNFEFRSFMELVKTNVPLVNVQRELSMAQCKLFATYVFLSQEERMRFAQMPHEYLIEQVQAQVENVAAAANLDGVVNRKITLTLNHPIKEIMFVYQALSNTAKDSVSGNNWFEYNIPGFESEEIFEEANIQMNGHDRFVKRPAKYWRLVQPWSHHTRCPAKKVHCYSFALHPESWQNPSGAANFSRIDSAHLNMTLNNNILAGRIRIHALGYNILRIAQGLSGLVFAN